MRSRSIILAVLLAVVTLAAPGARMTLAQEATPATGATGLPVTPGPEECTVDALSASELFDRAGDMPLPGTPEAQVGIDLEEGPATPDPLLLPDGDPADEATVTAITETMREAIACINSGSPLRFFGLTTDAFVRSALEADPITEEELDAAIQSIPASPVGVPEESYISLIDVRDARELPDGRVAALIETGFPPEAGGESTVDFFIFAEQDGRLLIDEVIEEVGSADSEPAATPVS